MPLRGGVSIWIEQEHGKLEEYKVTTDSQFKKQVTAYVPCTSGKTFRIGCQLPAKKSNYEFRIWLDGREIRMADDHWMVFYSDRKIGGSPFYFSYEENDAGTAKRAFLFGKLQSTDDDCFLDMPSRTFGQILITVTKSDKISEVTELVYPKRPKKSKHKAPAESSDPERSSESPEPEGTEATASTSRNLRTWGDGELGFDDYVVHERSKVLALSCVRFGDPIFYKPAPVLPNPIRSKPIPTAVTHALGLKSGKAKKVPEPPPEPKIETHTTLIGRKDTYTFVFYYRTMDFLLAEGIAPTEEAKGPEEKTKKRKKDKDGDSDDYTPGEASKSKKSKVDTSNPERRPTSGRTATKAKPRPPAVEIVEEPTADSDHFSESEDDDEDDDY